MSQTALQRGGADLEHIAEAETAWAQPFADAAAARMAELEAAFAMFGVKSKQDEAPAASAEAAYRDACGPIAAPANDGAPAAAKRLPFPELKPRLLHAEPIHAIRLIQAIDWVVVALVAEFAARWGGGGSLASLSLGEAFAFILGALSLKAGLWLTDAYRTSPARMRADQGAGGLALGALIGLGIANFLAPDARGAAALAAIVPLSAMLLAGLHGALAIWIRAAHRAGLFAESIVIVGATDAAFRLASRAVKSGEVRVVAVIDDRLARSPATVGAAPVCGDLDALLAWEGLPHVDRIVITVNQNAEARVRAMIERLRITPNRVDLLLDYPTEAVRGRRVEKFSGSALICVSGRPRNLRRAIFKRAQDIVLGAGLLILFAPVMLCIAAAVRIDSRGPALYRQRRHGFNNCSINVLKFRTMRHDPGAPLRQVCAGDPRITRIGAFLRRTSLDELPQLFNVLKGEMSLVGPRPHAIGMRAAERELTHIVAEYAHRHRVKPGITGWAQVNGSRGPVETPSALRERVAYDLDYVARASFWLDATILFRTAPALLGDAKATR